MPPLYNLLKTALAQNQLSLPDPVIQKLVQFLELILTWNRVYNLTAITDPKEMIYLHLIDSLIIAPFLQGTRFLDVGSGAGFPGLPLALLHPEQHWVLIDKSSKKTHFLTQAVAVLDLPHVRVIHGRVETLQETTCFDGIVSRAFSDLKCFIETSEHLLCPHGKLLAMKGKYPEQELHHLPAPFHAQAVTKLTLQGMNVERHLVCLSRKP